MAVDRRALLSTSGLGVAAVGAAALAAAAGTSAAVTSPARTAGPGGTTPGAAAGADTALTHSLVAFVGDVRGGEISLLVGEEEVVVRDEALVARLLSAAAR